ncbi:MAG: hypothetical protein JW772_01815 [Candidatus Diapherotrites archaeon]|nr:hypothetical protein [Candidatus Diapherotrites archaeon]
MPKFFERRRKKKDLIRVPNASAALEMSRNMMAEVNVNPKHAGKPGFVSKEKIEGAEVAGNIRYADKSLGRETIYLERRSGEDRRKKRLSLPTERRRIKRN